MTISNHWFFEIFDNICHFWNFDDFWQFWQSLAIFDNFLTVFFDNSDNFLQFWQFLTILTISFLKLKQFLTISIYNFDNLRRLWTILTIENYLTILIIFFTILTIERTILDSCDIWYTDYNLTIESLDSWKSLLPDN